MSSERIGRYRVESVLGTGAFATVYRAVDERLDDTVAVKVLAENHSLDPEIRRRFLTEGGCCAASTAPTCSTSTTSARPSASSRTSSSSTPRAARWPSGSVRCGPAAGTRPVADLLAVARPLAHALDAIHRAGVVQRDVDPGNILLTTRGAGRRSSGATTVLGVGERIVLADLGLGKDLARHAGHTSAGGGSEGLRPPELRGGLAIVDHRADLWSLSALLVWLATGTPPGTRPVAAALATTGLPSSLAPVLVRSLADDPAHRHPNPLTWLADLEAALTPPA